MAVNLSIQTPNLEDLLEKLYDLLELENSWNDKHIDYESEFNIEIGPINSINYICKKV